MKLKGEIKLLLFYVKSFIIKNQSKVNYVIRNAAFINVMSKVVISYPNWR
jgi:hypothetical protein